MDDFKRELEDYFCRFTFGQFVTLILLEIVTLFFVFYLGARYGVDLLGPRSDVAQEGTTLPREHSSNVEDIVGEPSVDYTYPEVLTGAEGQKAIRIKPSGVSAKDLPKNPPSNPSQPSPAPAEIPAAVPEQAIPAPVAAAPEATPGVSSEEQTLPSKSKYAIQVGSFPSVEEATSSLDQWKKRGYSAFMTVGQVPDKGTWYRVRIGSFATRDEAQQYLEKLQSRQKISALVVLADS